MVALDALVFLPLRNIYRNSTFFVFRCPNRECTVSSVFKDAYRQIFAFLSCHRYHYFLDELRDFLIFALRIFCVCPFRRNRDFPDCSDAHIYCPAVHVDNILTFALVLFLNAFLKVFDCIVNRHYVCQLEECCLHYHVYSAAETDFFRDLPCVDSIEIYFLFRQLPFHFSRKDFIYFVYVIPKAVYQECPSFFEFV